MSRRKLALWAALFAAAAFPLRASTYLFYVELQGIAGYASSARKIVFSSISDEEAMQKPSLGFDFVKRFSGQTRDIAVLAIQARLAANPGGEKKIEPQVYNAYLRFKSRSADFWIGHNRPKFGLASYLDSHALLLQPLAMSGFGFDRDWGVGLEHDSAKGNIGLTLTTGTGMPLQFKGNYFLAGRVARGILEQDNATAGISAGYGKLSDTMGTRVLSDMLTEFAMAAVDVTWLRNNWENRVELAGGKRGDFGAFALMWRTGLGLLDENRLKLEAQPVLVVERAATTARFSVGATYAPHPDWTFRTMVAYDSTTKDARVIVQIYYYKGLRF